MVISTDVDPTTGEALGGKHQIFTARVTASDSTDTINWQRLSFDDHRHNIRPMIVTGGEYKLVLWSRGQYNTYTDYYLDTVGSALEYNP